MFDIGFVELLVIAILALIVVGPKDLPGMFRTVGKFTAKARNMAREFQRSMEDAADESGMGDIAKDLKKVTSAKNLGLDSVSSAVKDFSEAAFDPEASKNRIDAAKKLDNPDSKKTKAKKPAAKKAAAKKPVDEKPTVKKTIPKKPAAKKAAVKKPATKKATSKPKTPTKRPAAKKAVAKSTTPKAKS